MLISVSGNDRTEALSVAREFRELGFRIAATQGPHDFLAKHRIDSDLILKLHEGRPNIVDSIKNGAIQLVINTPFGRLGQQDDSYIRKAAVQHNVPYVTTMAAARAAAKGISASHAGQMEVKSLQSYHSGIRRRQR